jgi:UDP-3-O-[3-hydroxymyristoyl] glucosamine N-acyltransferase
MENKFRKPQNFIITAGRLLPGLLRLPFSIIFGGDFSFYFRHPLSISYGKLSVGFFSELGPFTTFNATKRGIIIGKYSQINAHVAIVGDVHIGDRVLIAPGCVLASGGHRFGRNISPRFSAPVEYKGTQKIASDVWIGANVTLIGPITIGQFSVIGAGLTLRKSIPPNSLVVADSAGKIRIIDLH